MQHKEKYTNQQLADLLRNLMEVQSLKGVKFALTIAKNVRVIRHELEPLDEVSKASEEFLELSQKVRECEANKDEKGIQKLEKENVKLVDERKKQLAELAELMKDEVEVSLFKISENKLPNDITAQQILGIELIVKE